jgi:prepilin-type processing-associated H-X9-DG protein/prepilin-type N-terminal cleavage/methylation domain-containing protein
MNKVINRSGHTLVEMLFSISIIGVILGIALPAVLKAKHIADRLYCQYKLRDIGISLHNYESAYNIYPPVGKYFGKGDGCLLGWHVLLLPYLGQDALYTDALNACNIDSNPFNSPPHTTLSSVVKPFVCSSDSRLLKPQIDPYGNIVSFSSYLGIAGIDGYCGFFQPSGIKYSQISDGLSNTIAVGERPPPGTYQAGVWYSGKVGYGSKPNGPNGIIAPGGGSFSIDLSCASDRRFFGPGAVDNPCDRQHLWSLHPGGVNFLFCDGSVRYISYSFGDKLGPLLTTSGGEANEL